MVKPDWKDAPQWAQWLAQDWDGTWAWFEKKPIPDEDRRLWHSEKDELAITHNWDLFDENEYVENWNNTLEQRPGNEQT